MMKKIRQCELMAKLVSFVSVETNGKLVNAETNVK